MKAKGLSRRGIAHVMGKSPDSVRHALEAHAEDVEVPRKKLAVEMPRILVLDIETAPMLAHIWGLFDQNVGLSQIKQDWHILAWAAKWLGSDTVYYHDQRNAKDITNDKAIIQPLWKLMNEADIIVGQNSKRFDVKKINARFIHHNMSPPSSYRQLDTLQMAKKHFAFSSNKLEYLSDKLCNKYKKLKHTEFAGFDLWKECMAGNPKAWKSMEKYNKYDILSTEELFLKLQPWSNDININVFTTGIQEYSCICGSTDFVKNGFAYTNNAKYQKYRCKSCGMEHKGRCVLTKEKRKSLRK